MLQRMESAGDNEMYMSYHTLSFWINHSEQVSKASLPMRISLSLLPLSCGWMTQKRNEWQGRSRPHWQWHKIVCIYRVHSKDTQGTKRPLGRLSPFSFFCILPMYVTSVRSFEEPCLWDFSIKLTSCASPPSLPQLLSQSGAINFWTKEEKSMTVLPVMPHGGIQAQ